MQRHCPNCQRLLRMADEAVGRHVRCPACLVRFPVESAQETLDETAFAWLMQAAEAESDERQGRILANDNRPQTPPTAAKPGGG